MKMNRITGAYLLALAGCAKPVELPPTAPQAMENAWDFELQLQVDTEWSGAEEAGGGSAEAAALHDAFSDFELSWVGQITEGPYQVNRDGTESWRLLFKEVLDENESDQDLQGRAVETRRFPGGTLLSMQQAEWVSSTDSLGDGLDPMVALMFLLPPERKGDKLLFTDFAWPFRLGSARRSQHTAPLGWEENGEWLHFEGPLSGRIQDRDWALRAKSSGQLKGRMRVSENGQIEETQFRAERTLLYEWGAGAKTVRQKQVLSGALIPAEARMVAPWLRPFYLKETDVVEGIGRAKASWESCSPSADWSVPLDFEIGTDGRVLNFDSETLEGCAGVLGGLVFPPHHLPGLRVRTQLVIRSGVFQPYPSVRFPENPKPPLHLLLAPGSNPGEVVDFLRAWL